MGVLCCVRIFRDKAYSFPYFMDKCFYELRKAFIERFFEKKKPQKRKTSLAPISYANILSKFSHVREGKVVHTPIFTIEQLPQFKKNFEFEPKKYLIF